MDASNPLLRVVRLGLIGLGLFMAGALLSFGYSYRPLHGAKTWKIEQLEQRLDERNRESMTLSDELARLESLEKSQIDPDTFARLEKDLAKTRGALEQAERDLKRADQKRKDANASASTWRSRYEKLRDQKALAAAAPAPFPTPAPAAPAPAPESIPDTEFITPQPDFAPRDAASPHSRGNGMLPYERPTSVTLP